MGRRLNLHPLRRLRNPARHLRSLARQASDPPGWLPSHDVLEGWADRFWHWKAPIDSKLVAPRDTNPAIKAAVAQSLLEAAANASRHLVLRRKARVACLLAPENLFASEVTIFFDDDYFQTFLPPAIHGVARAGAFAVTTAPATIDVVPDWGLQVPKGLRDFGGYLMTEQEDGDPDATFVSHHWVFAEPAFAPHPVGASEAASSGLSLGS